MCVWSAYIFQCMVWWFPATTASFGREKASFPQHHTPSLVIISSRTQIRSVLHDRAMVLFLSQSADAILHPAPEAGLQPVSSMCASRCLIRCVGAYDAHSLVLTASVREIG